MISTITIQQFQENFNYYIARVEQGDQYKITGNKCSALLVLSDCGVQLENDHNYLCDHNDAC